MVRNYAIWRAIGVAARPGLVRLLPGNASKCLFLPELSHVPPPSVCSSSSLSFLCAQTEDRGFAYAYIAGEARLIFVRAQRVVAAPEADAVLRVRQRPPPPPPRPCSTLFIQTAPQKRPSHH